MHDFRFRFGGGKSSAKSVTIEAPKYGGEIWGGAIHPIFLPRDASAERGDEIAFVCPSVRPSVCDDQVS